jgi:hypothetical protein
VLWYFSGVWYKHYAHYQKAVVSIKPGFVQYGKELIRSGFGDFGKMTKIKKLALSDFPW